MLFPYRQPLVDEMTIRVVRCLVRSAIRKGRFQRAQVDDLVQDSIVHLLQKAHCFDPAKACWATFCALVVRNFLSRTKRNSRRHPESLDSESEGSMPAGQVEEVHSVSKRFTRLRTEIEWIDIEDDVAFAVDQLPTELREVCEYFQEDTSVAYVAEQLGVSRNTVYRRRQMVRESMVFESLAEYR